MSPVYCYECLECKKELEVHQKMNDEKLKTCPDCGGELQMLISHSSFKLKGQGWHTSDYGKNGPKK